MATHRKRPLPLTAEASAQAIMTWLHQTMKLQPESAELVKANDQLWLDMANIDYGLISLAGDIQFPRMVAMLSRRPPSDIDARLHEDPFIVTLHTDDPTPAVKRTETSITTDYRAPFQRLLIFSTTEAVIASEVQEIDPEWGVTATWPFDDWPPPTAD